MNQRQARRASPRRGVAGERDQRFHPTSRTWRRRYLPSSNGSVWSDPGRWGAVSGHVHARRTKPGVGPASPPAPIVAKEGRIPGYAFVSARSFPGVGAQGISRSWVPVSDPVMAT
jgi:hypothetical protein